MRYLGQEYLGQLPTAISHKALEDIAKQKEQAMKGIAALSRPNATVAAIGRCEGVCSIREQCGLPCKHLIAERILQGKCLTLDDVDPHWHLQVRLDQIDPYTRIRNQGWDRFNSTLPSPLVE
jgi:hypothetical protein